MSSLVLTSNCPDLELLSRGKVRDIYRVDESQLLLVATDRISAFDIILENGIVNKGKVLTQLSVFWFDFLKDVLPNHLITHDINQMPPKVQQYRDQLEGRSLLIKSLNILPIEAIVRGYISGSGWKEYKQKGTICDIPLKAGLKESDQLDAPLFTPSTKAEIGEHDENIHPSKVAEIIGEEKAKALEEAALKIYTKAAEFARSKGIIIADTKFEFGVDSNGVLHLADEVLTPDSSRFWPLDSYTPGAGQDSYDKQIVRNYLESINIDKSNLEQKVTLPDYVVEQTLQKYIEVYEKLTGTKPQL